MVRILHAADLHMDSPFEGLPAGKAAQRRREQRQLLVSLGELAARERVDMILLAGDLLDSGSAYAETAELLLRALQAIRLPIFIAPGNHDYYSPTSPYGRLQFPEHVHIFKKNSLECVRLPELGVRVWGGAFTDMGSPPLLRAFAPEKEDGLLDLLCVHGEVGVPGSRYNPISEGELAGSGMDYAALGHVHGFSGVRRAGHTVYAWPGCAEGRGFDETGEKGVILAEVETGRCQVRFVPLEGRRYEILSVDLTEAEDVLSAVRAALPEKTERDIYRILLTGECDAAPDLGALTRGLEDSFYALQLRDNTQPRRDIWAGAGEDTLRGLFLARLHKLWEQAPNETEKEKLVMAVRWGLAALDAGEEPYGNS